MVSHSTSGTALIVGANIGNTDNDPSWKVLVSKNFSHLDKVFMEPHPGLFQKLKENIKEMPRATAINAALTNASGTMKLYCLGLDSNGNLTAGTKAKGSQPWWTQICSGSPERLTFKHGIQRKRRPVNVSGEITEYSVPTMTAAEVLKAAPSPVRYAQIDVEGFDDQVLSQLSSEGGGGPFNLLFEPASFRPQVVVFEYVLLGQARTDAAIHFLNARGYTTCYEHQNVVGILEAPAPQTGTPKAPAPQKGKAKRR